MNIKTLTLAMVAMALTAPRSVAQTTTTYQAYTGAYGQCASITGCTGWQFVQTSSPAPGQPVGFATVTYTVAAPTWTPGTVSVTGAATITFNDGKGNLTTINVPLTGTWTVTDYNFGQSSGRLAVAWSGGTMVHNFFGFIYRRGLNIRDEGGILTVDGQ